MMTKVHFYLFLILLSSSGLNAQDYTRYKKSEQSVKLEIKQKNKIFNSLSSDKAVIRKVDGVTPEIRISNEEDFRSNTDILQKFKQEGKVEDLSKRDAFSKTYKNADASYTAVIGAGPIHYEKNGKWQDIDTKISRNSSGTYLYSNKENLMESYFGGTAHQGVMSKTAEGEVKEFLNTKMYWEVGGQEAGALNSADVSVMVAGDKAYYNNLYGNISAEYITLTGKRKLNYIISTKKDLGDVPIDADYLVFSEDIILPSGWTATETMYGIEIRNSLNKKVYLYENPTSNDIKDIGLFNDNTEFSWKLIGNTLIILTKVKTTWLLSKERTFPVYVDPTTSYAPLNSNYWTAQMNSAGGGTSGSPAGGRAISGTYYRGFIMFNMSNIPAATISAATVTLTTSNRAGTINADYPIGLSQSHYVLPNWSSNSAQMYNYVTNANNFSGDYVAITNIPAVNSSATYTLPSQAFTDIARNTGSVDSFFCMTIRQGWTGGTLADRYVVYYDHTSGANAPKLTVTYTTADKYCRPVQNSANCAVLGDCKYVGISNVNLGTINNASAYNFYPVAYSNYTSLTTNVSEGTTYPLKVTYKDDGGNRGRIGAWIDWNDDGDFEDENEFLGTITNTAHNTQYTINFTVPAGTSAGTKRLRIRSALYDAANDDISFSSATACLTSDYGETEDYNLVVLAAVTCSPVNASATKYVMCAGETTTLTASSTTPGYTYTWYKDWDNGTHTGTSVGTGASVNVSPTVSQLYGVVATKAGCPTGVNAAYQLITIAVTPPPTLVVLDPVEAVTCSGEIREINVMSGGSITSTPLNENWNPTKHPWITSARVGGGGSIDNAQWYLSDSSGIIKSPDNSTFVMVDSDRVGPYSMESSLISPPFSLVDYNTSINLTFNHYFQQYSNWSTAYVEITKDGINWTSLRQYTTTVGGNTTFAAETISLNAYVGEPFLQIRFRYYANYAYYWAVDDVKITGNPKPTTVTWSPMAGLYNDALGTIAYTGTHATKLYASPANTTTYTVAAKTAIGCPAETTVTVERGDKEYIAATGNWNDVLTWLPNGIPTENHCVRIPNGKSVIVGIANAKAKNLTVQSGGKLTVKGNLSVTDFVKNEAGADDFVVENDANLLQINNVENIGSITVKRNLTLHDRQQYNYMISPTEGTNLKDIYYNGINPVLVPIVLYHNEANNKFYNSSGAYIKGRALAVKEPSSTSYAPTTMTAQFTGKPTNGTFTYTLVNSEIGNIKRGFNLIGNPYPSNIDLYKFYEINKSSGNLSPTFYLWDNAANTQTSQMGDSYNGNAYAQFNVATPPGIGTGTKATGDEGSAGIKEPKQYIKVGQGFMAQVSSSSKIVTFDNSIRATKSGVAFFGRKAEDGNLIDRYWLKLISPGNIASNIAVVYFEGGVDGFTQDDSRSMGGSDAVYSLVDGEKISINGKSSFTDADVVPLGTSHFAAGNYTITLDKTEGVFANGQSIYLKDKDMGTITDLSSSSYTFSSSKGEFTNRFEIIYKPETILTVDNSVKDGNLIVYRDGEDFAVHSTSKTIDFVEVYDMSGRLYNTIKGGDKIVRFSAQNMASGTYVLKIVREGEVSNKRILK